jgi:hypothetical protein
MEDNFRDFFTESKALISEYLSTRWRLFRLEAINKISRAAGTFFFIIIAAILAFLVVLFLGLLMAYWLSGVLDSYAGGFLITAAAFILIFVIILVFRRPLIERPLTSMLVRNLAEELDEDDDEDEDDD